VHRRAIVATEQRARHDPGGSRGAASVAVVRLIAFDPERLRAIDDHGSTGVVPAPPTRMPTGSGQVGLGVALEP
jgi:hypothetical protein